MKTLAFFDTKPYDRESFDRLNAGRTSIGEDSAEGVFNLPCVW